MKNSICNILIVALCICMAGCGGGGGGASGSVGGGGASGSEGGSTTNNETLQIAATVNAREYSLAIGKFASDSSQFLVMAGLQHLDPGKGITGPSPVKIFKLNDNGTMSDFTAAVLGGAVTVYNNAILIADFNKDGIDDLFLPGFSDTQELLPSVAFISRPGQSHIRVDLPDLVYAHGATVIDANNDGHVDVMSSWGEIWFNDGQGNFRFQSHSYTSAPGFWIHGSGVCAGDFVGSGKQQVVLVDQMMDPNIGPKADTVIFELDVNGLPTAQHYLPVPILDRNNSGPEKSHDVTCRVADINNDGMLDVLVFSRPWALPGQGWTNQGVVQTLINRGNWQFEDTTDTSMSQYNTNVLISYTPFLLDLNGDGKIDLWASYMDWDTGNSNQIMMNNGSGIFSPWQPNLVRSFSASAGMIPVKFGDKWAIVFGRSNTSTTDFYITKPVYTFR